MTLFLLMLFIFVLGYTAIALEHPLHVNKAATALLMGMLLWAVYGLFAKDILNLGFSPTWKEFSENGVPTGEELHKFQLHFLKHDLAHHLGEVAEILFFLLGAMTIVETVDRYQGFKIITDKITSTNKVKLLWIISILTFFMSAALDNLTTTIVIIALLRKLIGDQKDRWFFASMVVLAANAGGAWSPIGDVTTIMLWVKENVTTLPIIASVFLPSLVTVIVPLIILSFSMKGNITRPKRAENEKELTSPREQIFLLIFGVSALLFVPVFKTVTHLPPYIGMLLGLGAIWLITEIILRRKEGEHGEKLSVIKILEHVDVPTIFFFLGILLAVAALQSAGHLNLLVKQMEGANIFVIDMAIGLLSSVVDNVPLVAGAMGMYDIATPEMIANNAHLVHFAQDGAFWSFLAYTAGTGGSILIIGSAAGVAAMGMEKINFIWYLKKISWLAAIGYFSGSAVYILIDIFILHH